MTRVLEAPTVPARQCRAISASGRIHLEKMKILVSQIQTGASKNLPILPIASSNCLIQTTCAQKIT
jgi:hypothetical protein